MSTDALQTMVRKLLEITRNSSQPDMLLTAEVVGYLLLFRKCEAEQGRGIGSLFDHFRNADKNVTGNHFLLWVTDTVTNYVRERSRHLSELLRMPDIGPRDSKYVESLVHWVDDLTDLFSPESIYAAVLTQALGESRGVGATPLPVVQAMVQIAAPAPGVSVLDPAAGSGGFLLEALRQTAHDSPANADTAGPTGTFTGFDVAAGLLRLGAIHAALHGWYHLNLEQRDALMDEEGTQHKYDVILSNPPFGARVNDSWARFRLPTTKSEALFTELSVRYLRTDGRCVMLIPDNLLFASASAERAVRQLLLNETTIEAVISLPAGALEPATSVKASILVFRVPGPTEQIWFYEIPRGSRGQRLDQELQTAVRMYKEAVLNRQTAITNEATEQAQYWWANLEDIVRQDGVLAASIYRPAALHQEDVPDPQELIDEIRGLEAQLTNGLANLEGLLGRKSH